TTISTTFRTVTPVRLRDIFSFWMRPSMPVSARRRPATCWQFVALAVILVATVCMCGPMRAQDDEPAQQPAVGQGPLAAAVYATGWALDATGYHPAILIEVENSGDKDLSGHLIRFQAMFTDRRQGQVVRAREEMRKSLERRHR